MFEIGDYVLNATNGICKISEIVELDMSGDKQLKSYFLLRPVEEENDRVYIPVDTSLLLHCRYGCDIRHLSSYGLL